MTNEEIYDYLNSDEFSSALGNLDHDGVNPASIDERIFSMTITAAANNSGKIYLTPGLGYKPGIESILQDETTKVVTVNYPKGVVRDGAFKSVDGTASFNGNGSPDLIEAFLDYIRQSPITVHRLRISSTDSTMLNQQLIVSQMTPFRTLADKIITPSLYLGSKDFQDKVVDVPLAGIILGADIRIATNIIAGTSTTYTFFCGYANNPRKNLERNTGKVFSTLMSAGIVPTAQSSQVVTQRTPVLANTLKPLRGAK